MLGPPDSRASSARIPAWRSAAVRPRMAARSWREANPVTGQIVCLRLTGQVCADTARALFDAVGARVRAAVPPPGAVVLDLSDILAADDGARAALESLRTLLANGHTCLRLVLPEGEARAALCGNGASAIGIDALHTSVRAAILAAHAALPGQALRHTGPARHAQPAARAAAAAPG